MKFSKTLFESLVGKIFTVHLDGNHVLELRLANISTQQTASRYESFTLNFDPPPGTPALPDDSYLMAAEGFGPELIHISATHAGTPDPNVYYYEAVFNVFLG
ncbi:DUF6916 family protein [Pelobacter propionicus]|uniref:DUF6916 domain-containing protein n=1 Tax=Pelobacter propionicus (strain DSM 2379 / NBRC 103807 / OttBd1) TaxID=338966 RepID=A1AK22_PELPD|nr:hypothetical protein [Pelobacter propionicus]ABK97692.1 hypothetical protein Ppro_0052 [Pelobacter propionicus DSM 2379]